jgi:hypothetical protein
MQPMEHGMPVPVDVETRLRRNFIVNVNHVLFSKPRKVNANVTFDSGELFREQRLAVAIADDFIPRKGLFAEFDEFHACTIPSSSARICASQ